MGMSTLLEAVNTVRTVMVEYGAPYPVCRTRQDLSTYPPQGVAYWVLPRLRRTDVTPWFAEVRDNLQQHADAIARGVIPVSYDRDVPTLLIFWPIFLRHAVSLDKTNPFQIPAWRVLAQLVPLIAKFDKILAHVIPQMSAASINDPAQDALVDLVTVHLTALTLDKAFRRALDKVMRRSLRSLIAYTPQYTLRSCPTDAHRVTFNSTCPECASYTWLFYGVTTIWPERIKKIQPGVVELDLDVPYDAPFKEEGVGPWDKVFQYALSCRSPAEGAVTLPNGKLLVDFNVLTKTLELLKVNTVLSEFTGEGFLRGVGAREACVKHAKTTVSPRDTPLLELVQKQGWTVYDAIEQPCELFDVASILARFGHNYTMMRRKHRPKRKLAPQKSRLVWYEYPDLQGNVQTIYVLRHKRVNYFSVPWPLKNAKDEDLKPRDGSRGRRHKGTTFWSLHGIVNLPRSKELKLELEAFELWVAKTDANLVSYVFRRRLYDQQKSDRLAAIQRGERHHLALYSESEEETLRRFFEQRSPGMPDPTERRIIEQLLPGRKWPGIARKAELCGKEFARLHGWDAYCQSGWKMGNRANRRKQWRKEGIL